MSEKKKEIKLLASEKREKIYADLEASLKVDQLTWTKRLHQLET